MPRPDYGTLLLHLAANDASTIYNDSAATTLNGSAPGPVGAWMDKVTGTVKAVQATGSKRPVYEPYGVNGQPSVRFDGQSRCLQIASIQLPAFSTLVVVGRFKLGTGSFFIEQSATAGTNPGFFFYGHNVSRAWGVNRAGNLYSGTGVANWMGADLVIGSFIYSATGGVYYKNGISQANGAVTGTLISTDSNVTSALNIGARNDGASFLTQGDILEILNYAGAMSAPNHAALIAELTAEYFSSPTSTHNIPQDGNSLVLGFKADPGKDHPDVALYALPYNANIRQFNFAVINQTLVQMQADAATQIDTLFNASYERNILVCDGGTNDFSLGGASVAQVQANFATYMTARRAAGWTIVYSTITPRTTSGNFNEANRQAFNTWAKLAGGSGGRDYVDAIVDVELDPNLGAAGANTNNTYYDADDIHPNNAGQALWAALLEDALLALFPPAAISVQPVGATKNVGESITFEVTATGAATITYQWYKDGIEIPGATNSTYEIASITLDDAGDYTVVVINPENPSGDESSIATLDVELDPIPSSCEPQDLLDQNPCLMALSEWNLELIKTQLLCNLGNYLESGEPVTCDIQTLLDQASCFNALSPSTLATVQAQLLCNLVNYLDTAAPVTCDVQELLDDARCFNNLSPKMLSVIHTQLLCNLSNAL